MGNCPDYAFVKTFIQIKWRRRHLDSVWVGVLTAVELFSIKDVVLVEVLPAGDVNADPAIVTQVAQPLGDAVHKLVMSRFRERTDLADHAFSPVSNESLVLAVLRHPHAASTDDVGHDAQALRLVSSARVVRMDWQMGLPQVLKQRDAGALVLDQKQINPLLVFAIPIDHIELFDHLGAELGILQVLLPAVDHHDAHAAVQWLEHAQRDTSRRVVDRLV